MNSKKTIIKLKFLFTNKIKNNKMDVTSIVVQNAQKKRTMKGKRKKRRKKEIKCD